MSNPPLIYVECDVPEGMTLQAWRQDHAAPHRMARTRRAVHHPLRVATGAYKPRTARRHAADGGGGDAI